MRNTDPNNLKCGCPLELFTFHHTATDKQAPLGDSRTPLIALPEVSFLLKPNSHKKSRWGASKIHNRICFKRKRLSPLWAVLPGVLWLRQALLHRAGLLFHSPQFHPEPIRRDRGGLRPQRRHSAVATTDVGLGFGKEGVC